MTNDQDKPRRFAGFRSPNYTQVPDELFDELMADLSGAELKVLLYIVRRTFGFKRTSDRISLSQMLGGLRTATGRVLDRGTGLSKPTLLHALRSLARQNVIGTERRRSIERGDEPTVYRLKFADDALRANPVVKKVVQGEGRIFARPVVKKFAPQETATRQTETSFSNIRNNLGKDLKRTSEFLDAETRMAEPQRVGRIADARPFNHAIAAWRDRQPSAVKDCVEAGNARQEGTDDGTANHLAMSPPRPSNRPSSPPRPQLDEIYPVLQAYVAEFARELDDLASLKTSTTRAYNLYRRSGLDRDAFIAQLYAARAIVKERAGRIRNTEEKNSSGAVVKRKAAYYYAVLEDLLGLRVDASDGSRRGVGSPQLGPSAPQAIPSRDRGRTAPGRQEDAQS